MISAIRKKVNKIVIWGKPDFLSASFLISFVCFDCLSNCSSYCQTSVCRLSQVAATNNVSCRKRISAVACPLFWIKAAPAGNSLRAVTGMERSARLSGDSGRLNCQAAVCSRLSVCWQKEAVCLRLEQFAKNKMMRMNRLNFMEVIKLFMHFYL